MELKDMVLSTLAEIEKIQQDGGELEKQESFEVVKTFNKEDLEIKSKPIVEEKKSKQECDDTEFLESTKERLLVLFEGLQATKSDKIASRLELTLNFLEFLLASIDDRLQNREK